MSTSSPSGSSSPKGVAAPTVSQAQKTKESIQDTIISVIIAFALAFVFRGFVVEAFVIPTGSMAPTLMGAHERIRSPESGYTWPVGPWSETPPRSMNYDPIQKNLVVHDPMTGQLITGEQVDRAPRRSGDRILVLKYLYSVLDPQRFDVVVFKFKDEARPEQNYIKRLVGLPGEEIALVDGDVFFRRHVDKGAPDRGKQGRRNTWEEPGWQIARKPAIVQQAMWQKVFDSDYAPRNPTADSNVRPTPWRSGEAEWTIDGRVYEYRGTAATDLFWDASIKRNSAGKGTYWDIDDRYPYDESPMNGYNYRENVYPPSYPVSDIRMGAGILPQADALVAKATITARSYEFQMELNGDSVILRMRPQVTPGETQQDWKEVKREKFSGFRAGQVTNVAFCNIDQTLEAWIEGKRVASFPYEWSPAERIKATTGRSVEDLLALNPKNHASIFGDTELYQKPRIKWSFQGSPVKLYRVSVDRDIYYQPVSGFNAESRGHRPEEPMMLNDDQFFVCGDNSPASLDARLWPGPEPFVRMIDPTAGVVPRKLMLGRAFFVYFPAVNERYRLPIPDFGRMRFIW